MDTRKVGQWNVLVSTNDMAFRKMAMADVFQGYLRKQADISHIENYAGLLEEVSKDPTKYETLTDDERDFYDMSRSVSVWMAVTACVRPYISIDEWRKLNDTDVNELSEAAMELNPHWFALPDAEKKTKKRLRKSTTDSMT